MFMCLFRCGLKVAILLSTMGRRFTVATTLGRRNVELGHSNQGPPNGGVKTGGLPDLDSSFLFCPFWAFPVFSGIFPICSGMVRGFSRFVPFLFLGLLRAPTRNSPERVRDTIWTFPEKSGKHPGLETPWFSFSQSKVVVSSLSWLL